MGLTVQRSTKPVQVNPVRLSQPMGAALAFFGVDRCMPLMHGAIGCTSFTKVFYTRHFCEPIAIQTTAVSDVTAILDGGDYNIVEAIKNITAKVAPDLIGLHTTGLTETKGDDIRGVARKIDFPLAYVNTPDYEGGLESGWALAARAMIEQLVEPQQTVDPRKLVLLPNVNLQPIEVEKIKEFIGRFGFEVRALPDLSTALDGHLGEKQAALSSGGITVEEIRSLAEAGLVLTVGASMRSCGEAMLKKSPATRLLHCDHLHGLAATDALVAALLDQTETAKPPAEVVRWRQRLQDVLLDSHFSLGQTRFALTGEPDQVTGLSAALREAGGRIALVVASADAPQLAGIETDRVLVGDLEDAEDLQAEYDLLLGSTHVEALAHRLHKGFMLRGIPNWEQVGNALKHDVLYEGSAYLLCEAANIASAAREGEA